jgi:hypothetical protein
MEPISDTTDPGLTLLEAASRLVTIDTDGDATIDPITSSLTWGFHTDSGDSEHPENIGDPPYTYSLLDFHPDAEHGIVPEVDYLTDPYSGSYPNFNGGIDGQDPYSYHQAIFKIGNTGDVLYDFDLVQVSDVTVYFGTDFSGSIDLTSTSQAQSLSVLPVPSAGRMGLAALCLVGLFRRRS